MAAYAVCVAGFVWLGLDSLRFRKSLRSSLNDAYSTLNRLFPDSASDSGKVLNRYYEALYEALPHTFLPGLMLIAGSTILFLGKRPPKDSN